MASIQPSGTGVSPISESLRENPIVGSSNFGAGVTGTSAGFAGVSGTSIVPAAQPGEEVLGKVFRAGDGVFGKGQNGVHGLNGTGGGTGPDVIGCGVFGESDTGFGVYATSKTNDAVHGETPSDRAGVSGSNTAAGPGVFGGSDTGYGVQGKSTSSDAVHGETPSEHAAGVSGNNTAAGPGVFGGSDTGFGVQGKSTSNHAVHGETGSGAAGVAGINTGAGSGIWGTSKTGNAGEFHGNVLVKGDLTVTGNVTATDVILSGADCAEEFDLQQNEAIEPGSVVVFDANGALAPCDTPYDKTVAGIISGAGKFRPGVILDRRICERPRAPLALVGKAYCKVDSDYAAINLGDLLTTSATRGHAMKAQESAKSFGAIIGKALAPLDGGTGLIPVLITLG
jgi:hypothetical protein